MLVLTLPFSTGALRWAAGRYLPGRSADIGSITGEPTLPLWTATPRARADELASPDPSARVRVFGSDRLVMEALPVVTLLPRATWSAGHYRAALTALADLHATCWGQPPNPADYPWAWSPLGYQVPALAQEARAALLEIEAAPWGRRFFSPEQMRAWLHALDDIRSLLDILQQMPHTLIHGGHVSGHVSMPAGGTTGFDWQMVGVGPAPYDLACFYASSRWWFGRVPLSLAAMRNHYLQRLNERLGQNVDRYLFDAAFDAARAWRFLTLWPATILERHASLLASRHHLQTTVIEPAYASLRRCMA